jgi:type II secretory pathway pseudopilin PulG
MMLMQTHQHRSFDPRSSIVDPRLRSIRSSRAAFTLVELMISIAMVVLLMIGIHQVFKMSSDTIGIGHAVGDMSRSNRSVQAIFHDDFQRVVRNSPLFIIRSGVVNTVGPPTTYGAFNSEADRLTDRDGDPLTQDLDGDGNEGPDNGWGSSSYGEETRLSIYNNRNHRVDVIGFPARGFFRRHTANDGMYSSTVTSQDAFIFYQHLALPPVTAVDPTRYHNPGERVAENVSNLFGSQFILGRVALLMRDPSTFVSTGPTAEQHIMRTVPGAGPPNLTPLHWDSQATQNTNPITRITSSRFDLLGASLEQLRQDVSDIRNSVASPDGLGSTWWQTLCYRRPTPTAPGTPVILADPVARFECNPRITKPITSEAMAKAMPVLLPNCSQFIVEYAGDFVSQIPQFDPATNAFNGNAWGEVTSAQPDGVIDFVVDHTNSTPTVVNLAARTRWYGLPRDTNGDRFIPGFSTSPGVAAPAFRPADYNSGSRHPNEMVDVVPLWDILKTISSTADPAPHEREVPIPAPGGDYGAIPIADGPAFRYTCVWSNSSPSMIRIVLKLEDPAGRLPDGQWFEYVLGAP